MTNAVVSESALRELLAEALGNEGAMGHDAEPPIVPNAVTDRTTIQLDCDPIELRHVPRSRNELIIMVRNLLEDVPDDQSGELYRKIKDVLAGDDAGKGDFAGGRDVVKPPIPDINQARELQRDPNKMESKNVTDVIRQIVREAMAGGASPAPPAGTMATSASPPPASADDDLDEDAWSEGSANMEALDEEEHEGPPTRRPKRMNIAGHMSSPDDDENLPDPDDVAFVKDLGGEEGPFSGDEDEDEASAWDPEPLTGDAAADAEEEEEAKEKAQRKSRAGLEIGAYGVDGMTLEKIGAELGFTKEAAKKAIETAMERFKVLHEMDPEDRAELVMVGVSDYIDMLSKTGEMTEEEEEFMRLHPKVVAMGDNFRDFFSKYVKKAAREMRADTQDDVEL